MVENDTYVRREICQRLNMSEVAFFELTFNIYCHVSAENSYLLPQYLQKKGGQVFLKSVAFRKWFNHQKAENDHQILTFMRQFPPTAFMNQRQYMELQMFYFEQEQYPNKAVIELAVKAWKERTKENTLQLVTV